jgi:RNase P protein component
MATLQTLKISKDFQAAKNGKFIRSGSFLLQALKVSNENIIKVGYTVTKQNGNAC